MKLATAEDMRKIDEQAVKGGSLTLAKLMESAGEAVVNEMEAFFGTLSPKTIGILCGKGHNGGDGFVAARLLKRKKASVVVVLAADPKELEGEPQKQFLKMKAAKIPVLSVVEKDGLIPA